MQIPTFLLILAAPLALAVPQKELVEIQIKDPYTCCRYPGWPTTVLNFEYPEHNPDFTQYHGLTWKGWSGYNFHFGYPTGWAPIPSNYTTLAARVPREKYEVTVEPGTDAFEDVHSLWFNYYELGPLAATTWIVFTGWYQGNWVGDISVETTTANDNGWRHACFNWTGRAGTAALVDRLTILLPDCQERKCETKWFEVDDLWVRRQGGRVK